MGLGRRPAPRREYRGTPSFLPSSSWLTCKSPLPAAADGAAGASQSPASALELLGFFENYFCGLEAGVAAALAELAASSGAPERGGFSRSSRDFPAGGRHSEGGGCRGGLRSKGAPSGGARGAAEPGNPCSCRGEPVLASAAGSSPAQTRTLLLSVISPLGAERVKPGLLR